MGKCISKVQGAFLPGKRPVEDIVIAKDLLQMMSNHKRRKKYCVIKLDIKKAYDKLSWTFLRDCLYHMGFS